MRIRSGKTLDTESNRCTQRPFGCLASNALAYGVAESNEATGPVLRPLTAMRPTHACDTPSKWSPSPHSSKLGALCALPLLTAINAIGVHYLISTQKRRPR